VVCCGFGSGMLCAIPGRSFRACVGGVSFSSWIRTALSLNLPILSRTGSVILGCGSGAFCPSQLRRVRVLGRG
jgi:hypothetical protein